MTDLTEQWKKGELPSGWYWVDYYSVDGAVMLEYIPQHNGFGYDEKNLVQAVLAELPDYIEWQNMVNCACEEHKANTELLEENAQLKELLKECKNILEEQTFCRNTSLETDETLRNRIVKKAEILQKINEALR